MNLRANLQGSKCDIMHIFMTPFFYKEKFLCPFDPVVFYETLLPKARLLFCETDRFSLMLPPCNPDFPTLGNTDFKKMFPFECSAIVGSLSEKGL